MDGAAALCVGEQVVRVGSGGWLGACGGAGQAMGGGGGGGRR
eukprot:COSAG06_NODE_30973_length_529_cov_0.713953_2_plen_41_part_01